MARMHSRIKGKSGSKKPAIKTKPAWVKHSKEEISELVIKLKKEDKTNSQIGIELRDNYGIPGVKSVINEKISKIIASKGMTHKFPEDLMSLMKKAVILKKHLELNKHDVHNKRSLQLIESKIGRLVKYYSRTNKIPSGWTYSYDKAKLLVE